MRQLCLVLCASVVSVLAAAAWPASAAKASGGGILKLSGRPSEAGNAKKIVEKLDKLGSGAASAKLVYSPGAENCTVLIWAESGGPAMKWRHRSLSGRIQEKCAVMDSGTNAQTVQLELERDSGKWLKVIQVPENLKGGARHNSVHMFYPLKSPKQ